MHHVFDPTACQKAYWIGCSLAFDLPGVRATLVFEPIMFLRMHWEFLSSSCVMTSLCNCVCRCLCLQEINQAI